MLEVDPVGRRPRRTARLIATCAICGLTAYALLFAHGWEEVGRLGDDGIRVRPVSRTGLLISAVLPGSAAAGKDLTPGSAIDGVDGLVSRDERELLHEFLLRPAGRESRLHVQHITPGGGTGAGLGATRVVTTVPRPRLSTPVVARGLTVVGVAGASSLVAAIAAGVLMPGWRAPVSALIASSAVAGLVLLRLYFEAGHRNLIFAPVLLGLLLAATVSLLTALPRRGPLLVASLVALTGAATALFLAAAPLPDLDPRHALLGADIGLASLALIPIAAVFTAPRPNKAIHGGKELVLAVTWEPRSPHS